MKTDIFLYSSKDSSKLDNMRSFSSFANQDCGYWKVNKRKAFQVKGSLPNYRLLSNYKTKPCRGQVSMLNSTRNDTSQSQDRNISQPAIVGGLVVKAVSINLAKERSDSSKNAFYKDSEFKEEINMIPVDVNDVSKTLSIDTVSYVSPKTVQAKSKRKIIFAPDKSC
mmetsp:Transcript_7639/g.7188  ORF Transcript_7639/g.7188 Transcript_7639/m.7188 type:complete len:167 (-) Transcript_7639:273-773(-)